MGIYDLYKAASDGDQDAEARLFDWLSVRFRYLVNNRVWDPDDAEDLVQTALMAVLRDYRSLNGHPKFEAWAYKILDNRILGYVGSKSRTSKRHVEFDDSIWMSKAMIFPGKKMTMPISGTQTLTIPIKSTP